MVKSSTFIPQTAETRAKLYTMTAMLQRLDRYGVVILDDIGYVQPSRQEMEVLFTFMAECYERRAEE